MRLGRSILLLLLVSFMPGHFGKPRFRNQELENFYLDEPVVPRIERFQTFHPIAERQLGHLADNNEPAVAKIHEIVSKNQAPKTVSDYLSEVSYIEDFLKSKLATSSAADADHEKVLSLLDEVAAVKKSLVSALEKPVSPPYRLPRIRKLSRIEPGLDAPSENVSDELRRRRTLAKVMRLLRKLRNDERPTPVGPQLPLRRLKPIKAADEFVDFVGLDNIQHALFGSTNETTGNLFESSVGSQLNQNESLVDQRSSVQEKVVPNSIDPNVTVVLPNSSTETETTPSPITDVTLESLNPPKQVDYPPIPEISVPAASSSVQLVEDSSENPIFPPQIDSNSPLESTKEPETATLIPNPTQNVLPSVDQEAPTPTKTTVYESQVIEPELSGSAPKPSVPQYVSYSSFAPEKQKKLEPTVVRLEPSRPIVIAGEELVLPSVSAKRIPASLSNILNQPLISIDVAQPKTNQVSPVPAYIQYPQPIMNAFSREANQEETPKSSKFSIESPEIEQTREEKTTAVESVETSETRGPDPVTSEPILIPNLVDEETKPALEDESILSTTSSPIVVPIEEPSSESTPPVLEQVPETRQAETNSEPEISKTVHNLSDVVTAVATAAANEAYHALVRDLILAIDSNLFKLSSHSAPHLRPDHDDHHLHVQNYLQLRPQYHELKREPPAKEAVTELAKKLWPQKLDSSPGLTLLKQLKKTDTGASVSDRKIDFLKQTVEFLKKLSAQKTAISKDSALKALLKNLPPNKLDSGSRTLLELFESDLEELGATADADSDRLNLLGWEGKQREIKLDKTNSKVDEDVHTLKASFLASKPRDLGDFKYSQVNKNYQVMGEERQQLDNFMKLESSKTYSVSGLDEAAA